MVLFIKNGSKTKNEGSQFIKNPRKKHIKKEGTHNHISKGNQFLTAVSRKQGKVDTT